VTLGGKKKDGCGVVGPETNLKDWSKDSTGHFGIPYQSGVRTFLGEDTGQSNEKKAISDEKDHA